MDGSSIIAVEGCSSQEGPRVDQESQVVEEDRGNLERKENPGKVEKRENLVNQV